MSSKAYRLLLCNKLTNPRKGSETMGRTTVYNHITTPELIAKISEENKELYEDFLSYLSSIDRSVRTIESYKSDLEIFFCWNLENNKNKDFITITKREFSRFQDFALNTWNWSPSRVRRVKSTISSISTYIENILDEEPKFKGYRSIIKKIENPVKEAVREKTVLSDEQVDMLLNYLVENKEYKKACAVALAAFSGCRKTEILRMKTDFFTDENIVFNSLYKTDKIKTKGRGKNGKQLNKYVLLDFKKYYDLWMEQRKELGIDSEWLFVGKLNGVYSQMKVSTLDGWANVFSKILGVDFYFHCLRHQLCTRLSKLKLPQNIIKEFFGWNGLEMISIYNDTEASEEFGKYFTSDGIVEVKDGTLSDLNKTTSSFGQSNKF
jgi:integrase